MAYADAHDALVETLDARVRELVRDGVDPQSEAERDRRGLRPRRRTQHDRPRHAETQELADRGSPVESRRGFSIRLSAPPPRGQFCALAGWRRL